MVLDSTVRVGHYTLEDLEQVDFTDHEAGLFEHLAADCVLQQLSGLDNPARQGPFSLQGLAATLDKQNAVVLVKDEGADAEEGAVGITAANIEPLL